jgi:hypothetical protein
MIEDQERQDEENENSNVGLNKAIAILFVLAIYFVIFLKILFIK